MIMTKENNQEEKVENDKNDICEECLNNHESVFQNLILNGYKICKFCKTSKTIFPI